LGDVNNDGSVNEADLQILRENWGNEDSSWSKGDFNGDNVTDAVDLNILVNHWQ
jgi:hypothetical protein